MENTGATLTGKASVDKPWLQFYPEALRNVEVPTITVETFLRAKNPDENKIAFEYYGNKISAKCSGTFYPSDRSRKNRSCNYLQR